MPRLTANLPPGLWQALAERAEQLHEAPEHIIARALAEYLDLAHHTLYQVSLSTALVSGVYQGAVRVGTLREHGDFGLGTFENLDGEMIAADGRFFQARGDGLAHECDDSALVPFAVVTRFEPSTTVMLERCEGLPALQGRFDRLRPSENLFYALRVDGHFDYIYARAMCKTKEGVPLVEAAAVQPEFEFHDIDGTLVGFWTPRYAGALNVPGYHFHFLSHDRQHGGHLLECRGRDLQLGVQHEGDYRVALSEAEDFLKARLTRDPVAEMAKAEGKQE